MRTLDDVLTQLAGHGVIRHEPDPNAAVNAAVEYIGAHYAEPLTVAAVATAVNLSTGRLAHVFSETTGMSVMDYVARLRVNIARRLLLETSDTLEKIAVRLGFADASNLSRNESRPAPGATTGARGVLLRGVLLNSCQIVGLRIPAAADLWGENPKTLAT